MKEDKGVVDIESFPGIYRSFGDNMYETSLLREEKPVTLASYSIKTLGKRDCKTVGVWEFKSYQSFVKEMHKDFMRYRTLTGHNAKRFDLRQSNTFFAQFGLRNTNVEIEDTLRAVKKHFKLPSYKLKYCLKFFGLGEKLETGGDILWEHAEKGCDCKRSCRKWFLKYNENDTIMTELLRNHLHQMGYMQTTKRQFYNTKDGCVRCGSHNIQWRGEKPYKDGWHQYLFCKECGKYQGDELLLRPWG